MGEAPLPHWYPMVPVYQGAPHNRNPRNQGKPVTVTFGLPETATS
jgi:hypothetical protein